MIKEMIFVTNNHILVQFDSKYVPLKDENDTITESTPLPGMPTKPPKSKETRN